MHRRVVAIVFNATFNNISAIPWRCGYVLGVKTNRTLFYSDSIYAIKCMYNTDIETR
jgi:hypothetical protein